MTLPIEIPDAGKVLGIGCDLAEVQRIKDAHERHGQSFLDKVFTPAEQEYCLKQSNPYPSLAARWAAKEAMTKALSTGVSEHIGLLDIEVTKGSRNEPKIQLSQKGDLLLYRIGGKHCKVTLSHTREIAMAVVAVLE